VCICVSLCKGVSESGVYMCFVVYRCFVGIPNIGVSLGYPI